MRRILLTAVSLGLLLIAAYGYARDLAIVGASVYPSPDAKRLGDATVVVRNGRIERVGRARDVRVPDGMRVIDGRGTTVVAGFWNSHVHLIRPDLLDASARPAADLEAALQRLLTRWGFTVAFELAGVPGNALALRQRIERGELRGPLLLTTDAPFYPRDGTPIYVRKLYADNRWPSAEVATADEAKQRARAQLAAGADGVKLFTGAIVGFPDDVLPMDAAIARAAVAQAHAAGKPAFAHPSNVRGIEIALASGVDVLAHATPADGQWSARLAERLRESRIALVPTLKLFEDELAKLNAPAEVRTRFARNAAQQLRSFARAGGTILFGTDAGYIDDADTTRELQLIAKAGLSWRRILASLTTAPAARFGYASVKGRVAAGMDGDLVVLGSDPQDDPAAFADVRATIRGGVVVYERRE
jgi:imidazolonepropionase-like amidohydrolase